MPIYEFRCDGCGNRFEELTGSELVENPRCPSCGGPSSRLFSPISPPGRQPRGAKVRDSESRRREREAARQERLAETAKKRARGELPARKPADGRGEA